ncbi:MAG: polyprenol monophosphomannose synthase [candidate division KSB1 bacterium]|nr:polyprenol monophosphomannose synthase [candidate division KSB1 bacterium]
MRTLIVIPTYNEAGNVKRLLERVFALGIADLEVLVVDDNSPDGTAVVVEELQQQNPAIHLIRRPAKMGLGTAYVAGFKYAIEHKFDLIFEMDADLSHNPDDIPRFLDTIQEGYDLVIGSRYLTGVNVINWPLSRLLLSLFANWYTRTITGLPLKDCTSGFKCFRRTVLESIDLDKIQSDGYSFQIELHFIVWKKGFRFCEIPIIFTDRDRGSSKMSRKVMIEAALMVWRLKFWDLVGKI